MSQDQADQALRHGLGLTLTRTDAQGQCSVALSGRLTYAAHEEFARALAFLEECGGACCVLDLSGLTTLDSAGLWMLQEARDEVFRRGSQFIVQGAGGPVLDMLSTSDLPLNQETRQAARMLVLVADQAADPLLARQAVDRGMKLAALGGGLPAHSLPILTGRGQESMIQLGLGQPYAGFLEAASDGIAQVGHDCLSAAKAGGLSLSVTTATAYGHGIVPMFAEAVTKRLPAHSAVSADSLSLALGEAVSNAVIHGNLGIDSAMRATRDGFAQFRQQMKDRLSAPESGGKRIDITCRFLTDGGVTLKVRDNGNGFDLNTVGTDATSPNAKFGRGIALIRKLAQSVASEDGGRTLVMTF